MTNDPIADLFIRIRNAQAVKKASLSLPASKMKESILRVLKESGYIADYKRQAGTPSDTLEVELQYHGKEPAITHLQRVSKAGARRYAGVAALPRPLSGHGLSIISTPKGVMSGAQAQKEGLGGEVIATVW